MNKLKYLIISSLCLMPLFVQAQVTLTNPLGESDVRVIIARVIQGALGIVGSLALVMVIYGGFLWMTAMGHQAQVDKGKQVLIWATLGIVVIASAYVLTNAIFNALLTGNVAGTP